MSLAKISQRGYSDNIVLLFEDLLSQRSGVRPFCGRFRAAGVGSGAGGRRAEQWGGVGARGGACFPVAGVGGGTASDVVVGRAGAERAEASELTPPALASAPVLAVAASSGSAERAAVGLSETILLAAAAGFDVLGGAGVVVPDLEGASPLPALAPTPALGLVVLSESAKGAETGEWLPTALALAPVFAMVALGGGRRARSGGRVDADGAGGGGGLHRGERWGGGGAHGGGRVPATGVGSNAGVRFGSLWGTSRRRGGERVSADDIGAGAGVRRGGLWGGGGARGGGRAAVACAGGGGGVCRGGPCVGGGAHGGGRFGADSTEGGSGVVLFGHTLWS